MKRLLLVLVTALFLVGCGTVAQNSQSNQSVTQTSQRHNNNGKSQVQPAGNQLGNISPGALSINTIIVPGVAIETNKQIPSGASTFMGFDSTASVKPFSLTYNTEGAAKNPTTIVDIAPFESNTVFQYTAMNPAEPLWANTKIFYHDSNGVSLIRWLTPFGDSKMDSGQYIVLPANPTTGETFETPQLENENVPKLTGVPNDKETIENKVMGLARFSVGSQAEDCLVINTLTEDQTHPNFSTLDTKVYAPRLGLVADYAEMKGKAPIQIFGLAHIGTFVDPTTFSGIPQ